MEEVNNKEWLNKDCLLRSLVYAVNYIPFYRKYDGISVFKIYDILPEISKNELIDKILFFTNSDLVSSKTLYSSGFTSGVRTPINKSNEEIDFINNFFKDIEDENVHNIYLHYVPAGDYIIKLKNLTIIDLHSKILDIHTFGRQLTKISNTRQLRIIGLESQLRLFTYAILRYGIKLNIQEVVSGGDIITNSLNKFYRKNLGENFTNRFGMTEIFGGATKFENCGLFHFDAYTIFDLSNYSVEGKYLYGDLLLSSTYPFSQKIFLLKYITGDYVSFQYCNKCKQYGVKLLGRKKNLLFYNNKLVFSSNDLYDKLDDFEEIAKSNLFSDNIFKIDPSKLGHLRFRYYTKAYNIFLTIVLWDTIIYNHNTLRKEILDAISGIILLPEFKFIIEFEHENSAISAFLPDEIEN